MQALTAGIVFVAVWLGLVLLYCLFRLCGGRAIDILGCRCFRGSLCNCWGLGGRVDEADASYPLPPTNPFPTPFDDAYYRRRGAGGGGGGGGVLPVVVLQSGGDSSSSSSDDDSDAKDGSKRRSLVVRNAQGPRIVKPDLGPVVV
jgi:hypothetical protein